jgi:DNA ligase-1
MNPDPTRRALLLAAPALAFAAFPFPAHASRTAPMLAQAYRPGLPLADFRVSEKYDGVRGCWDGERLRTRQGRPLAPPAWFTEGWPAQPMEGELWAGRNRFTAAASATARQVPDDAEWRRLRFMAFDLPAQPGVFDQRLPALQRVVQALAAPWVEAVPQQRVADEAALQSLLRQVLARGGEGLMLHRGDAPYRGERSDALLKLKPHEDAEARVLAHLPGKGKYEGLMGALQVETPEGLRFRLGGGFSDAERRDPPPPGSQVTYRYRGLHPNGAPRFASFLRIRED